MRRLTHTKRDDHGVATIILIGAMTGLLIAAAIAIDVGRHVAEVRAAQNSADATVLAVATDCAAGRALGLVDYTKYYKSTSGQTINSPACGSGEATITVTKNVNGGLLLDRDAKVISRSAKARWGTIGGATTAPLVISACEFDAARLAGTGEFYLHMGGNFTPPPSTCVSGSPPGGFGWLSPDSGCTVATSAAGTVLSQPGNAGVEYCVIPWLGKEILVPIYSAYSGTGNNATYTILGYATFKLTGYSFNGNDVGGVGMQKKCPLGNGSTSCIRGDFVSYSTEQGTIGTSPNMGTLLVYLYS